jgi:hypothetical protein
MEKKPKKSGDKDKDVRFALKSPCNNCPYRMDAPLQLWDKIEFKKLLEYERVPSEQFEKQTAYGCHKKNGNYCAGWVMQQIQRGMPSIPLRLALLKAPKNYVEELHCESEMFDNVEEMCYANYPELEWEVPMPQDTEEELRKKYWEKYLKGELDIPPPPKED